VAVSLQQSLPEMAKKGKNPDANDADDATTDRQSQQASIAAQIIRVDKICLIFKRKIRVVASLIT